MALSISDTHLDAWRGVLNVHASVVGAVERELARRELPPLAWYDVLWAVRRAPGRRLRMAELAENVTISRGGLTKLADRLQAEGLLRREAVEEDRRGFYAVLTDAGAAMLRRMWPTYERVLKESFARYVSAEDAETIAVALGRVSRGADAATPPARRPSREGEPTPRRPRRGRRERAR